jgi:hypothetical protein
MPGEAHTLAGEPIERWSEHQWVARARQAIPAKLVKSYKKDVHMSPIV